MPKQKLSKIRIPKVCGKIKSISINIECDGDVRLVLQGLMQFINKARVHRSTKMNFVLRKELEGFKAFIEANETLFRELEEYNG